MCFHSLTCLVSPLCTLEDRTLNVSFEVFVKKIYSRQYLIFAERYRQCSCNIAVPYLPSCKHFTANWYLNSAKRNSMKWYYFQFQFLFVTSSINKTSFCRGWKTDDGIFVIINQCEVVLPDGCVLRCSFLKFRLLHKTLRSLLTSLFTFCLISMPLYIIKWSGYVHVSGYVHMYMYRGMYWVAKVLMSSYILFKILNFQTQITEAVFNRSNSDS